MPRPIKARPFDFPYDGKLDPTRLALLVIDLQIDFVSADSYLAKRGYDVTAVRVILPAVRSVIEAVRRLRSRGDGGVCDQRTEHYIS